MSEEVDIQVSEILDGELDESRLSAFLKRYNGDDGLRKRFSRYVLARDCLHRINPQAPDGDFADRVMNALADEPVVLAPRRSSAFSGERWRGLLKPAAGLAVAASVATVAVLGLRGDHGANEIGADAPRAQMSQPVASDTTMAGSRSPDFQYADVQVRRPVAQTVSAGDRTWLNDYLLRHKEASGFVGRSGFTPYVHIVATEAPDRAADSSVPPEREREESLRRLPVNTRPE